MTERFDISPDRWPDVSRVFSAAVGVEKSARNAYLDEACRDDAALRVTVDSMLRAHDEAGSFGDTPAFVPSATVKRLAPDTQLGPFRIETLLGAGGMGEVYRAHDTKLQRAVAIKVLPDSFANDADRRSRFEEEARALAALNHPHIGAIYGVEESEDVVALVLELVDGLTLDERLAAGPIAFDEVFRIARQLADGLEAAHDRGIVHRDFKPGNIKITPDGNVKILDFGLAKIDDAQIGAATVGSPSGSRHATQAGVVVGTAGYMSPEQARGLTVDKRTDIWAFGCVLFRMCAQQPPFTGTTVTDALKAVIAGEPDWDLLPASTPPYLVRILRRCLTKDPKLRLRDIGEARIALDLGDDADAAGVQTRAPRYLLTIAAIATTIALAASLAFIIYRPTPSISAVRFHVFPPEGGLFDFHPAQNFLSLSPDGLQLAFLASTESAPSRGAGSNRIWLRALTDLEARPLQGTDGATSVFWSPSGRSLAFVVDDKLKRFDLPAGPAVTLCDPCDAWHGTWGAEDVILLAHSDGRTISAVSAVPAAGGTPWPVLTADRSKGDVRVHWPWFLPDGKRFLFTARRDDGEGELRIGQLDGATHTLVRVSSVMRVSSNAQWVEPDVLVFAREGVLMAQRVDLNQSRPVGEPFPIADQVEYFFTTSRAMFSASPTGTIAYHPGGDLMQLVWVDHNGNERGTIGKPADYNPGSRLSQDGRKLLTARRQPGLGGYDIWQRDLVRGTEEQLTFGRGSEVTPVWIEGERAIIFAGDSPGSLPHLFRRDLAAGTEEQILPAGSQQLVMDVLPGGRGVAYGERQGARFKILQLPLMAGASPTPLLPPQFKSSSLRVSPDGRAMAFRAGPEGRNLYVASFPITSEPELAGTGVRSGPRWSADGRQLYYVGDDRRMMTVPVRTRPSLWVGLAQQVFELKRSASLLEVSRDGRFLLLVPQMRAAERPIIVDTATISSRRQ